MSIAIITGASSGLGTYYVAAVSKIFPEIDELWLVARREARLKEVAEKYPDKHCVIIPMDLTDTKSYEILSEKIKREKPQIKVLINDAGMAGCARFEKMELSEALKTIDLNCKGTTAITRICLEYMTEGGSILNVSSTSAFVPNKNLIVYCATKAYVSAFTLGLREELKERKINACAMNPGLMLTEMNQHNGKAELTKGQKRLPIIDPETAALNSLKAAKKGCSSYTPGAFYKLYRLLAKLIPHTLLVRFAGLD